MSRCRKRDTDLNLKSMSAVRLREETATNDVAAFDVSHENYLPQSWGWGSVRGSLYGVHKALNSQPKKGGRGGRGTKKEGEEEREGGLLSFLSYTARTTCPGMSGSTGSSHINQ